MKNVLENRMNVVFVVMVLFMSVAFLPACEMEDEVIDFDDEEEIDIEGAMGLGLENEIFDSLFDSKFGSDIFASISYHCDKFTRMCDCKKGEDCDKMRDSGKCDLTTWDCDFSGCICLMK